MAGIKKKLLIGIIGGNGLMGRMFGEYFRKAGCRVQVAGRTTELTAEQCARTSDVLVISVPINITADIIEKVAPLVRKDGLIMDLTSLKAGPMKAMMKYSKCSVIGTHPVFGPGVKDFRNQTVVLCEGRGKQWQMWLEGLLRKSGAKIKYSTPEHHDKMMAIIQGLMHFTAITMSHVLREMKIDIKESLEFSSPIYKLRLDMVGRILNQEPMLYGNIEMMNPETPKVLDIYLRTSKKLYDSIIKKDIRNFISYFEEASNYLGDFKREAMEYSNYIINMLVKKR